MKNVKRVLAIICAAVLALMYIVTFIMAIADSSATMSMFKGCILCTIFVPLIAYGFVCLHKYAMYRSKREDPYSAGADGSGSEGSDDAQ